ncbi:MAG: methyltransferase domain-containing protein, partial [Halobacteria archaeon]|nr:methyltransferase domain-containing protein [Halobacteria archaeon]
AAKYLDSVTGIEAIQDYKRRSHRLLHPTQGDRILDVGCGMGDDVLTLAERVGPEGEVVGIDKSRSLIAEARERAGETNVASFQVGDAAQLPFADNEFDACRADRVFQHLDDPRGALTEMCRVTRPGGRITVSEPNWETCSVNASGVDPNITKEVTDARWVSSLNPAIGSRLYVLFREVGLTGVETDPLTVVFTDFETANEVLSLEERIERMQAAGVLSATRAEKWIAEMCRADRDEMFFCSITGFIVAGSVPEML